MAIFDVAKQIAERAATSQNKLFVVWRMPAWRKDIYGVLPQRELPAEAEVHVVKPRVLTLFDL